MTNSTTKSPQTQYFFLRKLLIFLRLQGADLFLKARAENVFLRATGEKIASVQVGS